MTNSDGPTEPSTRTLKRLFALSGNQCACPECPRPLVDPESGSILGEVCHIQGRKPGAARHDPDQTNQQRHGFDNLILLCGAHHKVVDDDKQAKTYTVELLRQWKTAREAQPPAAPAVDEAAVERFVSSVLARLRAVDIDDLLTPNIYPSPPAGNPASLLNARYQVVPFFDAPRCRELAALETWSAAGPGSVGVRLFYGPGGSGKTRLFIEWAQRLAKRGWHAGFLRERLKDQELDALVAFPDPVFIVVDYAEARPDVLELLRRVAARRVGGPLRVALLAREVADWWQILRGHDAEVGRLLDEHEPLQLWPVPLEGDLRQEAFAAACRRFSEVRQQPAPVRPPDLSDARFGRMLYLHTAALACVEGLPVAADSVLDEIVEHEGRYWRRQYQEQNPATLLAGAEFVAGAARAVAAVTLLGGLPTRKAVERTLERAGGPEAKHFAAFLRWLYPGRGPKGSQDAYLAPLEPDLLGQALVARVLSDRATPEDYLNSVFEGADSAALVSGFLVLGRMESRPEAPDWIRQVLGRDVPGRAEAAFTAALTLLEETAQAPLGSVLASVLERDGTAELARAFESRLPEQAVSLRELGVWTARRLLRELPPVETAPETLTERARLLNNLGIRLGDLGRREEALEAAREAVTIRRTFAEQRPEAFLPALARSLNNVGIRLSDMGRWEEALAAAQEAVELYRALAAKRPDSLLPGLAMSLNSLGNRLGDLRRREEALEAAREAAELYRALAARRPDNFLPALARSLANLGNRFAALGRRGEALDAAREAVEHYRALARQWPDAFMPDLATMLNNLGNRLDAVGRSEKALEATHEAVTRLRALAVQRPDAFLPDLASSLNNLGARLSALEKREESLAAIKEAVERFRALAGRRPDAFLPRLAGSLHNLGLCLSALEKREEALAATKEAVERFRALAGQRPDVSALDLATSLENMGELLSELGRSDEAQAAKQEAAEIRRQRQR